jgi:predicted dehydrogenase
MRLLLIGAGSMGIRHIRSIVNLLKPEVSLVVIDSNQEAVKNVQEMFSSSIDQISFTTLEEVSGYFDGAVVSTSAMNRKEIIQKLVVDHGIKNLLIEKPVEQSYASVCHIVDILDQYNAKAYVNFIRRPVPQYQRLLEIVQDYSQFNSGVNEINISGGAVGIGANGIHLIDFVVWFVNAFSYRIKYAQISPDLIPSGRGKHYSDFGGLALIDLFDVSGKLKAKTYFNLSSQSSIPYSFTINGPHARLTIDEFQKTYTLTMREELSVLPYYRYFTDYSPIETYPLELDLEQVVEVMGIQEWSKSFKNQKVRLPEVKETLLAHRILFDWLEYSNEFSNRFPIT